MRCGTPVADSLANVIFGLRFLNNRGGIKAVTLLTTVQNGFYPSVCHPNSLPVCFVRSFEVHTSRSSCSAD